MMDRTVPERLRLEVHDGVGSIPADAWDALAAHHSPFLRHAFLVALEDTGCVGGRSGWTPMILTVRDERAEGGELLGAAPMYLKTNSAGEFVFDWSWADAAHRAGISYYPKAVVAVPFTPIAGRRLLVHPDFTGDDERAMIRTLARGVMDIADQVGLSSVHFNFLRPIEAEVLESLGLAMRQGMQYHWYNGLEQATGEPFETFDDFLGRFRSKRRANLRRERRKIAEAGVTTRVVRGGEADDGLMRRMFRYYKSTVDKFYWGQQYLNEALFLALPDALGDQLHLVVAEQDGREFAGALNLVDGERLYGRYWGCRREVDFAHFEVCMYAPIAWCIEHGVRVFEPGAGGEHKYERGFEPTPTYSAHYIRHPALDRAVRAHLEHERATMQHQIEALRETSCLKT